MKLKPILNRIWAVLKNELQFLKTNIIQNRLYWPLFYIMILSVIGLIAIGDYSQYNIIYFFKVFYKEFPLDLRLVYNQLNTLGKSLILLYVVYRFGRQLLEKWSSALFHLGLVLLIIPFFQYDSITLGSRYIRLPYQYENIEVTGFCLVIMLPYMVQQLVRIIHPIKQWRRGLQFVFAWFIVSLLLAQQIHYPMLILWNLILFILIFIFWKNRFYWKTILLVTVFGLMIWFVNYMPCMSFVPNYKYELWRSEEAELFRDFRTSEDMVELLQNRFNAFRFGDVPDSTHYHPFFDHYTAVSLDEIKQSGAWGKGLGTFKEPRIWYGQVEHFILSKYIVFITFKQFGVLGFLLVLCLYALLFIFLIRNRSEQDEAQLVQWSMILFLLIQASIQIARTLNLAPLLPSYPMPFYGYGFKAMCPAFIALGWLLGLYTNSTEDNSNENKT